MSDNPYVKWSASGYRLHTEGEWQYASGATAAVADAAATGLVAWYSGNAGGSTAVVGTRQANALGIHDMCGNVWQWCWDRSGDLPGTSQTDYRGPASGNSRCLRGGKYDSGAGSLQVGLRNTFGDTSFEVNDVGFRVARSQQ